MNSSPNPLSTVYATKRRRRSNKRLPNTVTSLRPPAKDPNSQAKSNPSKRHRERLNGELDHLASLLPFEHNILSKLDRLSILRLAVAFLRTKSYFQVAMQRERDELVDAPYRRDFLTYDNHVLDGEMFLQALNGFLMILDCNGELFFATHTIETYLGFHQSDVIHQSVYELVHSEDREELQRQLGWNSFIGQEDAGVSLQELLTSDHNHLLDRSFTVRFRCLLDNTSGFLRLDIRGKIKLLHGQNKKTEEAPLALFCLCTPFGPPSLLEIPHKEVMFKSKHKLDFAFLSMDQRGKEMLQYEEDEMGDLGGYDLVHYDDLAYVASAHQELLKTGASGMIAYRMQTKDGKWQWLQTSSRLVYKNSKPDFIISTHRPLMEEEGRDLLGKRTMDFKVTYLDAGLTSAYFSDGETPPSNGSATPTAANNKVPKRYKAHLRDFLSSCRGKRAKHTHHPTTVSDIYAADPAAAAIPYASVYSAPTTGTPTYSTESPLYMQQNITTPYQTIYPVDNRYFSTDYLASYRSLTTYYPEYSAAQYIGNGYFDVAAASPRSLASLQYDPAHFNRYFEDKAECKYNAGTKTEYASPPSSAGPPPPAASSGKTASRKGSKSNNNYDVDFVPLITAVAVSACVTNQRDENISPGDATEIKCEPIVTSLTPYDFHSQDLWSEPDKERSKKLPGHHDTFTVVTNSSEPHWSDAGEKGEADEFDKISDLQQFHVERSDDGVMLKTSSSESALTITTTSAANTCGAPLLPFSEVANTLMEDS